MRYSLGRVYHALGRDSEAITAFQEAVRLKPDDAAMHSGLGSAYYGLRRYSEAVGAYQEAIRLKPDDASTWCGLGMAYDQLGQRELRGRAYERCRTPF
jgi:Flp pilus assembly protein TadD